MPSLLKEQNGSQVWHADWRELLEQVPRCDALFVDAPYSEKTHDGHGTMARHGEYLPPSYDKSERRDIGYQPWTAKDVYNFVRDWHPRVHGWMVSITDDTLSAVWRRAFEAVGRYAFACVPFVAPGSRVRLTGDGPSSWTCWIVVARPRTKAMAKWGALPGAYVLPAGQGGAMPLIGGKPAWLMTKLVADYSRPGDLVVDPCCGAGTTAIAAIREGRRAIVGDSLLAHAELAARWIELPWQSAPVGGEDTREPTLFDLMSAGR